MFHSPAFSSSVDCLVCPRHHVRLEECVSQNGREYVKCPMFPCLLFCAKEKVISYMREVYRQLHVDVSNMWSCLLCFCREPAVLQQSHPQKNLAGCF